MSPNSSELLEGTAEPVCNGEPALQQLIRNAEMPVVLESHFDGWEAPWRALSDEAWRELSRVFGKNIALATMETGSCRELAVQYGLEIIPTVLIFSAGEVVARLTGRVRATEVLAALEDVFERRTELEAAREKLDIQDAMNDRVPSVRSLRRSRVNESEPVLAQVS